MSRPPAGYNPKPSLGGRPCPDTGAVPIGLSGAFKRVALYPRSVSVDGIPFAADFFGDHFQNNNIPFHTCQNCFAGGAPPEPTEEVDIAVVGGGISGLSIAYLLREHRPVVFELYNRFGGVSRGESWANTPYSLGSAYVITPDEGTFLEEFYRELDLHNHVRVDEGQIELEVASEFLNNFLDGEGLPPEEQLALQEYADIVTYMGNEEYPDIPLPEGEDNEWILDLDRKSLRQDIEDRMTRPVPRILEDAVQAYCYSSFSAGWDEISAAGGWNFLAAEEFGRWVFPGGNGFMANQMWKVLSREDHLLPTSCSPRLMRAGCRVVDVRLRKRGALVTYLDRDGRYRSLMAKRVVMACSKMLCKHILQDLDKYDSEKRGAIDDLEYRGYLVANVLVDQAIEHEFYDIFLLGNGDFPQAGWQLEQQLKVIDVLNGHFSRRFSQPRSVLTLYWPLPYARSRVTLIEDRAWTTLSERLVPQLRHLLDLLNVQESNVRQVRLARWGHAMPLNRPNLIAGGVIENLRRPIDNRIFFVNQDNWALPAVENCLLDAEIYAPQITAHL